VVRLAIRRYQFSACLVSDRLSDTITDLSVDRVKIMMGMECSASHVYLAIPDEQ